MIEENLKKEIDLQMSQEVPNQKTAEITKLSINEDTTYDIIYDVYDAGEQKYFYIKMLENTAVSPFYYNISYTIEELHNLHRIFKSCDIYQLKEEIKSLFDEGKIKLSFDENETIIKMELKTILFVKKYKINFLLYREMIPEEEKDQLSLDLYSLEKKTLKKLKEMKLFLDQFKGNQEQIEIINNLIQKFNIFEIPGIEAKQNDNLSGSDISIHPGNIKNIPAMYINVNKKHYKLSKEKNKIDLLIRNIYDKAWPQNEIILKCKENSTLKCNRIDNFPYEIEKDQDGEFSIYYDPKDLEKGKYETSLELYVSGKKIPNSDITLKIHIK